MNNKNINDQVYLLREREFIKLNEQVYKIGRTNQQFLTRMNGYPKGTEVLFMSLVSNCFVLEETIKKIFTQKFIKRKDIGNEYFEGNVNEMLKIIREQINLQMDNIKMTDVNKILYDDIKTEINCITNKNLKNNVTDKNLKNDAGSIKTDGIINPEVNTVKYDKEELKLINDYNKSYSILTAILDDKESLKQLTTMSHKDALLRVSYKEMICDSDEPEIIKMYQEINTCKYMLYELVLNCFDELKLLSRQ